jgi:cytochrome P450
MIGTMAPTDAPAIDLYDPDSFAHGHPHHQYRWLREHAPVYRHPAPDGGHFWAVTRYHDIRTVERNPQLFTNYPTVMVIDLINFPNFLCMDGPLHHQLRRLVVPSVTLRAVELRMPALEEIARDVLDEVCERGECDLVEDVAGPMAGYTAADLLGISRSMGRRLHELFMVLHSSIEVQGVEAMIGALTEMLGLAQETWAEKREHPADDVYSLYAHAELDGRPITEEEFTGNFILLADGTLDTSRNLISGGMLALFDHPAERAALEADLAGVLPTAIEEMLRWLSPVTYIRRVALEDTVLHGQPIPAGDRVVVYFASGNRDAEAFPDPDRFDVRRSPNEHIAFGSGGPHYCAGSHLGRAEGTVMIRQLLTRFPDIGPAGPGTWAATSLTSGLSSLPVRFSPGRPGSTGASR